MARTRWKSLVLGLAVSAGVAAPAHAQDWGCQVLLCLANPGGPTQYAECVGPISKLWDALRLGNAFPNCSGASASTSGTDGNFYRKHGYGFIDVTPPGQSTQRFWY